MSQSRRQCPCQSKQSAHEAAYDWVQEFLARRTINKLHMIFLHYDLTFSHSCLAFSKFLFIYNFEMNLYEHTVIRLCPQGSASIKFESEPYHP